MDCDITSSAVEIVRYVGERVRMIVRFVDTATSEPIDLSDGAGYAVVLFDASDKNYDAYISDLACTVLTPHSGDNIGKVEMELLPSHLSSVLSGGIGQFTLEWSAVGAESIRKSRPFTFSVKRSVNE